MFDRGGKENQWEEEEDGVSHATHNKEHGKLVRGLLGNCGLLIGWMDENTGKSQAVHANNQRKRDLNLKLIKFARRKRLGVCGGEAWGHADWLHLLITLSRSLFLLFAFHFSPLICW